MMEDVGDDEIGFQEGWFIWVDPVDMGVSEFLRRAEVFDIAV